VKRTKVLLLLIVGIMVVGVVAGLAKVSAGSDSQPQRVAAEKVVAADDNGRAVEILPLLASRKGTPRLINAEGKWSLERLGYSDLELPCKERLEAISASYILPEDAAQGPDRWYVLSYVVDITFSEESDNGSVKVSPLTNGAAAEGIIFETIRSDDSLQIQWGSTPADTQSTSSLTLRASLSTYLRDADLTQCGVRPGANVLTFKVEQHDGAVVEKLKIHRTSNVEVKNALAVPLTESVSLSQGRASAAKIIALSDPVVQEILKAGGYQITVVAPWELPPGAGNARIDVVFSIPHQIQLDWPWPPTPIRESPVSGNFWVRGISIAIDLEKGVVTGISPSLQPWASPVEASKGPAVPALTDQEKALAKQIALADPRVRQLVAEKNYCVAQRWGDAAVDTKIGVWHTSGDLAKIGAGLFIWFDQPCTLDYDWPVINYDEGKYAYPHYVETTIRHQSVAKALEVMVDLQKGRVVSIEPVE
jgi:hypothetical protein